MSAKKTLRPYREVAISNAAAALTCRQVLLLLLTLTASLSPTLSLSLLRRKHFDTHTCTLVELKVSGPKGL